MPSTATDSPSPARNPCRALAASPLGDARAGSFRPVGEVLVHEADRGGTLSNSPRDPLDRIMSHIPHCEHARQARLEQIRLAAVSLGPEAGGVRVRLNEAPAVTCDVVGEPFRAGLRADEDENGVGSDPSGLA